MADEHSHAVIVLTTYSTFIWKFIRDSIFNCYVLLRYDIFLSNCSMSMCKEVFISVLVGSCTDINLLSEALQGIIFKKMHLVHVNQCCLLLFIQYLLD